MPEQLNPRQILAKQVIEEVKRLAEELSNVDRFTQQAVDLIQARFGFYFVSIFLVEPFNEWINFQAGTGEVGQIMRERGHCIGVSSKGIVGVAVSLAQICIDDPYSDRFRVSPLPSNMQMEPILPFKEQELFRIHPLLPDTRSQFIIPLRTSKGIIGILDIHSSERSDFDQEDVPIFLPLADQIALVCADLQGR